MTADLIDLARAGDGEAFGQLVGPYQRELQVHCYRMLGSAQILGSTEESVTSALKRAREGH